MASRVERLTVVGRLAALGVLAAVVLALSACSQGQSAGPAIGHFSPTTTAPPLPGGYGLIPAAKGLSDRIVSIGHGSHLDAPSSVIWSW